jgi:hypothetical protein
MYTVVSNTYLQKVIDEGGDVTLIRLNFIPLVITLVILVFLYFGTKKVMKEVEKLIVSNADERLKELKEVIIKYGKNNHE